MLIRACLAKMGRVLLGETVSAAKTTFFSILRRKERGHLHGEGKGTVVSEQALSLKQSKKIGSTRIEKLRDLSDNPREGPLPTSDVYRGNSNN